MDQPTVRKPRKPKGEAKTPEQRTQERRDRFVRLAAKRVNNALRAISNVWRLSNRASYSYTDEEAKRISGTMMDAVVVCTDGFAEKSSGKTLFSL